MYESKLSNSETRGIVQVATIVFAFKNNKLLQLLKRRGEAVMYADEEW